LKFNFGWTNIHPNFRETSHENFREKIISPKFLFGILHYFFLFLAHCDWGIENTMLFVGCGGGYTKLF